MNTKNKHVDDLNIITEHRNLLLLNVLYMTNLNGNFISVSRTITFGKEKAEFIGENNEVVLVARKLNNLFVLEKKTKTKFFK